MLNPIKFNKGGGLGARRVAICCNQRVPAPALNQLAIVAGNKIIDDAKIGGITPAIFNFNGRWEDCSPYIFFPTCLLTKFTRILPWPRSIKYYQIRDCRNQN